MKAPWANLSIQGFKKRQLRLASANRILSLSLPLVVIGALYETTQWGKDLQRPLEPILPSLEELRQPLASVPSLELPAGHFQWERPRVEPKKAQATEAEVAAKKTEWKLLGVSLSPTKRAFLQDREGKQSLWVKEGESLGTSLVKEIRERAVLLEEGEASYEIQM